MTEIVRHHGAQSRPKGARWGKKGPTNASMAHFASSRQTALGRALTGLCALSIVKCHPLFPEPCGAHRSRSDLWDEGRWNWPPQFSVACGRGNSSQCASGASSWHEGWIKIPFFHAADKEASECCRIVMTSQRQNAGSVDAKNACKMLHEQGNRSTVLVKPCTRRLEPWPPGQDV